MSKTTFLINAESRVSVENKGKLSDEMIDKITQHLNYLIRLESGCVWQEVPFPYCPLSLFITKEISLDSVLPGYRLVTDNDIINFIPGTSSWYEIMYKLVKIK